MAINDVKEYFYNMLAQYVEEKQNLADFEDALKDGLITETQMQEALEIVNKLENNYYRLAYIMFLLEMPNRKRKKKIYLKQNKVLVEEFKRLGVDLTSVKQENFDILLHFKLALQTLKNKGEQ